MSRLSASAALLALVLLVLACTRGVAESTAHALGPMSDVLARSQGSAQANAAESEAGYRIAFVSDRDGGLAVYSINPDGGDLRKLTLGLEEAQGVAVSPDGSRIAFAARHTADSGADLEVLVMNADGTGVRNLAGNGNTWDMQPSWSPDGESIAFTSGSNWSASILTVGSDGTSLRRLTDGLHWEMQPSWSPDGSQIAFVSLWRGRSEICLVGADGDGLEWLTDLGARSECPRWSPDGKQIAFVSDWDGVTAIYTMYADGSGLRKLTASESVDTEPCWSPDGTEVAFSSDRDGGFAIYVADVHKGGARKLTDEAPGWQMQPSWSPDGTRIAFAAGSSGDWSIYVVSADGTNLHQITDAPGYDLRPLWSPG